MVPAVAEATSVAPRCSQSGRAAARHTPCCALSQARRRRHRPAAGAASGAPVSLAPPSQSGVPPALGEALRRDFPILDQTVSGRPLVYLDNAATSQKPQQVWCCAALATRGDTRSRLCSPPQVLDALQAYYSHDNANVHRGVHALASRATAAYEAARDAVASFVGAPSSRGVVFTRGATEAINLVANTWGIAHLKPGDEVALSVLEHHSNLVPWQLLARRTGCVLRFAPLGPQGSAPGVDQWRSVVGSKTRLIATAHVSNVMGTTAPVADLVAMAKACGARVLLDACQSVPHMPVDFKALGVDFLVASGHKMCAPTGIGFLVAQPEVLDTLPPWQGGGEMIDTVTLQDSTYAPAPMRFEAGTPHIAGAIGLGAACAYLDRLDMRTVAAFEHDMGGLLTQELMHRVPGVTLYGPPPGMPRAALAAFNVDGLHATDVSTLLDAAGVAVRSGHHCTQPLHSALGINASARASLYIYNTPAEVDAFVEALRDSVRFLREAGL